MYFKPDISPNSGHNLFIDNLDMFLDHYNTWKCV